MKLLTCEMCGSTDLVKQEGVFICQSCGCKYSVEEAKKLMIEGTVDVQGTVKIDNTTNVQRYLENARRARKKEDWEEVEKYYNMVEQNEPENIEALFYSAYGKVMASLVDVDRYKKEQKCDVLRKSVSIIDDQYDANNSETLLPLFQQISDDMIQLTHSKFVYKRNPSPYVHDDYYIYQKFISVEESFIDTIENILKKDENVKLYQILVEHLHNWWWLKQNPSERKNGRAFWPNEDALIINKKFDRMRSANEKIRIKNPSYIAKPVPANIELNKGGGCYIATAVYGSYDCPQVWTLRRYRDYTLAETWYGRAFIRIYYAVSPTLVKWFGHTEWFKKMWQGKLDHMVAKLQSNGVESTPYEDKVW